MPRLRFEASSLGPASDVEAPEGGRLLDLCDESFAEADAPWSFSCRSARCGVCLVEVLEGEEWLLPPEEAERELLEALGARASLAPRRLACQASLRPAGGLVRLRRASA